MNTYVRNVKEMLPLILSRWIKPAILSGKITIESLYDSFMRQMAGITIEKLENGLSLSFLNFYSIEIKLISRKEISFYLPEFNKYMNSGDYLIGKIDLRNSDILINGSGDMDMSALCNQIFFGIIELLCSDDDRVSIHARSVPYLRENHIASIFRDIDGKCYEMSLSTYPYSDNEDSSDYADSRVHSWFKIRLKEDGKVCNEFDVCLFMNLSGASSFEKTIKTFGEYDFLYDFDGSFADMVVIFNDMFDKIVSGQTGCAREVPFFSHRLLVKCLP